MAFPLAAGVMLADGRVGVLADGRGGVLAVGRAEVLEDEGATEGVTGAAGGVTGEELADHSSSKRPLSSSSLPEISTAQRSLPQRTEILSIRAVRGGYRI